MSSIAYSRLFYINSSQRLSGTDGSFTYQMFLDQPYTHVVVMQANFPISYYIVSSGSNTFTLTESASTVTISIPVGNYNMNSFQTVLTSLLNTNSPHSYTYAVTSPNQFSTTSTMKYTFTVSGNGGVQPIIAFPSTSLVYEQCGFSQTSSNHFSANTLVSSNVVKFIPEDTLFIHSDICENFQDDILQDVYNGNSAVGAICSYQLSTSPEAYAKRMQTKQSNIFKFSITDEFGNIINFNGLNCLITVMLFIKDNSLDVLKKYIKYSVSKEIEQQEE